MNTNERIQGDVDYLTHEYGGWPLFMIMSIAVPAGVKARQACLISRHPISSDLVVA
jgi:hypothetical protein